MMRESVEKYVKFINEIGSTGKLDDAVFETIYHPICKKTVNGVVLTNDRQQHKQNLINAIGALGKWVLTPLEIIPSEKDKSCTLYFESNTEKLGTLMGIAILKFDQNMVCEIKEVYNTKSK